MAYVRTHGNQVAIVHGERDPESGKVQQRVLFTLYSRPEALAVLGRGEERRWNFQGMLEGRYPGIRFQWKRIEAGIEERLDHLPDVYPYRPAEFLGRFREDLCTFTRQLELADPQEMYSAAELLTAQRHELEYLRELIEWRLRLCEQKESEWNTDNRFFWRHRLRSQEVSGEIMEKMAELYNRGEYERLEALARFFIECFDLYADGHRYLGLVALERREHEQAIEHFEQAAEVGRRLFPKRLAKKHFWVDTDTRPYMRALRGLTTALLRSGRVDEALELCDRMERECGDEDAATTFRSHALLLARRWEEALEQARRLVNIWPEHSYIAAFASFELGRPGDARAWFLHALLNMPHAGHLVLRLRHPRPADSFEADDHNAGVELLRDLAPYFEGRRAAVRRFFVELAKRDEVKRLLVEKRRVTKAWKEDRSIDDRTAYDRMMLMKTVAFAREEAASLAD